MFVPTTVVCERFCLKMMAIYVSSSTCHYTFISMKNVPLKKQTNKQTNKKQHTFLLRKYVIFSDTLTRGTMAPMHQLMLCWSGIVTFLYGWCHIALLLHTFHHEVNRCTDIPLYSSIWFHKVWKGEQDLKDSGKAMASTCQTVKKTTTQDWYRKDYCGFNYSVFSLYFKYSILARPWPAPVKDWYGKDYCGFNYSLFSLFSLYFIYSIFSLLIPLLFQFKLALLILYNCVCIVLCNACRSLSLVFPSSTFLSG